MKQEIKNFMRSDTLTSSNYSIWIKKLEILAKYHNVWEYVDPHKDDKKEPDLRDYANVEDIDEDDLFLQDDDDDETDDAFELYCLQMKKRQTKKIASRMTTMHAALRMTAEISITICIKNVAQFLTIRFDLTS